VGSGTTSNCTGASTMKSIVIGAAWLEIRARAGRLHRIYPVAERVVAASTRRLATDLTEL
jgi:hypothetical protein